MIEQPGDASEDVVKDDDLVVDPKEQKGQGADRNGQENINGVEVGSSEHFQAIKAVVDGVVPPKERHFMGRPVVPVFREVDDQRDKQQLEQDVSMAGPNVEHSDVVVIACRARQDADQEKNVQVVNGRGRHEVDDIGSACFADGAPALLIRNVELQCSDQNEHEDVEAVCHDAQGKRPAAIDSPPKNSKSEEQDRPICKSTDNVANPFCFESALCSVHQLFAHAQFSRSQASSVSPSVGAQRIGRPAERFTDSYRGVPGSFKVCPRVVGHRSARPVLRKNQAASDPLWNRRGAENGFKGGGNLRGIQR